MKKASEYFKGRNFMTNELIGYYSTKDHAIELSYGTGIFSTWLVGVTVIDKSTGERNDELSQCFSENNPLTEAQNHLDKLGTKQCEFYANWLPDFERNEQRRR